MKSLLSWLKNATSNIRKSALAYAAFVVDRLVHTKPLPTWTNYVLFDYALLIWAFAIGLNFWGNSLAFVITGGSVLAILFVIIFAFVHHTSDESV